MSKDLYFVNQQKPATTEEKSEFVKRNKQFLVLPVYGELSDDYIDKMVYAIKNSWKEGGIEADIMLNDMYSTLKKAGYK